MEEEPKEDVLSEEDKELKSLRNLSAHRDVTWELTGRFRSRLEAGDPEVIGVQKQGYISEARNWLQSMTPEGMKYGRYTKEQRLAEAERYARLAGVSLGELQQ